MRKTLFIVGAGSHSSVIIDTAKLLNYNIKFIIDINSRKNGNEIKYGIPVKGKSFLKKLKKNSLVFLAVGDNKLRKKYFDLLNTDHKFINLISKSSKISKFCKLGKGIYIGPNVVINAGTIINNNCILNTSSVIEHDVLIGESVHIGPAAVIAGKSKIGDQSFIGLGSKIINNITIGKKVELGAGSLVVKDLKSNLSYYGVPAKKKKFIKSK